MMSVTVDEWSEVGHVDILDKRRLEGGGNDLASVNTSSSDDI